MPLPNPKPETLNELLLLKLLHGKGHQSRFHTYMEMEHSKLRLRGSRDLLKVKIEVMG